MATRIQRVSESVDRFASRRPRGFAALLAACLLAGAGAAVLALAALLDGPIGVELKERFRETGYSRLRVLQISSFVAGCFLAAFFALTLSWRKAPSWLQAVVAKRVWRRLAQRLAQRLERSMEPGRPALYWAFVAAAALWANVAILYDLPVIACVEPDTVGYLGPNPIRSAGYMLIVKAVAGLTGDLKWLVPVQLNVMLLSFATLGWVVRGALRSQIFGIIAAAAPMLSSGLLVFAPTIMSEAFFTALVCFHVAAVIALFRRHDPAVAVAAGVTLGLMIVVRPNGLSFLAGVPLAVFFARENWRSCVLCLCVPVALIVVAQGAYNQKTFGFFNLHRFGGISLAANAAPLFRAEMPSEYPGLAARLGPSLAHYARDFPPFEDRAWPFEMARVASTTAVGAIYYQILPAIRAHLGLPTPQHLAFDFDPRIDGIAGSLAMSAIRYDAFGFIEIVTSNYIANWHATLPIRVPLAIFYPRCLGIAQDVVRKYEVQFSRYTDVAQFRDAALVNRIEKTGAFGIRSIEWPRMAVGVFQLPLAYLAFIASLVGLILIARFGWRRDGAYRVLSYSALVVQSGYVLLSIGNASFTRYTAVFDPLVIVMLLASLSLILRYLFAVQDDKRMSSKRSRIF